jgi:predicted glycosyltransferase
VIKSGSYDFVIVDKNLGTHRGVSPLLDFLQEERPDTKVVLFSAEDGIRAKKELYCHAFVSKISVHYDNLPRNLHAAMQRVA